MDVKDKSDLKLKRYKSSLNVSGAHGPGEIPIETFAEFKADVEGSEKFKVFFHSHPSWFKRVQFQRPESKIFSPTRFA